MPVLHEARIPERCGRQETAFGRCRRDCCAKGVAMLLFAVERRHGAAPCRSARRADPAGRASQLQRPPRYAARASGRPSMLTRSSRVRCEHELGFPRFLDGQPRGARKLPGLRVEG